MDDEKRKNALLENKTDDEARELRVLFNDAGEMSLCWLVLEALEKGISPRKARERLLDHMMSHGVPYMTR